MRITDPLIVVGPSLYLVILTQILTIQLDLFTALSFTALITGTLRRRQTPFV